jgi:hypothetical protein
VVALGGVARIGGLLVDFSVRDFCSHAVWDWYEIRDGAVNGEVITDGAAV